MGQTLSFGEWLRRQRKVLDLTRDEVARRVPCSVSTLRRLEADDLRVSPALAESLARVLNVPPDQRAAFVALARGEPCDAPELGPLSGIHTHTNRLPAPLTEFIGRGREVAAIVELLGNSSVRLLTLTGPPGTGKTRLSLAAGGKIARAFPDGVYFVALEPIGDPDLVLATIAQPIGVVEKREGVRHAVVEFLLDKCALLILDNFEHLIPAAPVVADLLKEAPQIKILVTSREILHLYGEHEFPVPPLELLDVHHLPTPRSVTLYSRYSSIQLFRDRARAVKPDFRLTTENVADVARICAWLDGLPLAIEIAAAQAKWYDPAQLLDQLQDRLGTLTGGPRDLSPRQQSLRGAIDWSYQLLTSGERNLFDLLGIFWDGCAEEAILELGAREGDGRASEVPTHLRELVEKSLVGLERDSEGHVRYTLLEIMRDYARAKLAERGELERARQWHAEYYARYAQEAACHWNQADQAAVMKRVDREHNNVRAALAWALETPARSATAMALGIAMSHFWYSHSNLTEGLRWLKQIMALDPTPSIERTRLLGAASDNAAALGDYSRARAWEEEALAISQELGDQVGICRAMDGLAIVAGMQGDYARTAELLEQVLVYRRQKDDAWALAVTLNNLAIALRRLGNLPRAQQLLAESIDRSRAARNLRSLSHGLNGLGEIYVDQKDFAAAAANFREALALRHQIGDSKIWVNLNSLASSLDQLGASLLATLLTSASERIRHEIGAVLPLSMRGEHEDFVSQLRAKLGDAEFARAWAEGQSMSTDEVVTLAIKDPPPTAIPSKTV